MTATLIRLPPGTPFVYCSSIYYREFTIKFRDFTMVKCFPVVKGIVQFKNPDYFPGELNVSVYEFSSNNPT